jgi:hypothetical protein
MFEFDFIFEFDMFELCILLLVLTVGIGVGSGVGVEILVLRFTLLLFTVLFAAPPQAAPNVPIAKMAVSAIFFISLMISCLLQS